MGTVFVPTFSRFVRGLIVFAACGGWAIQRESSLHGEEVRSASSRPEVEDVDVAMATTCGPLDASAITELTTRVQAAVVHLDLEGGETAEAVGFVLDDRGSVITNYHVLKNVTSVVAKLKDGSLHRVEGVLYDNARRDLAILRIEGPFPHPALKISAAKPAEHEKVLAFGDPAASGIKPIETAVVGVQEGTRLADRFKAAGASGDYHEAFDRALTWIEIDAPVAAGNSGGPLVNASGEVIGLNTWMGTDLAGVGFAISADDLRDAQEHVSRVVKPLAKLPHYGSAAAARSRPAAPALRTRRSRSSDPHVLTGKQFKPIELPGATLVEEEVDFPLEKIKELFKDNPAAIANKDNHGRVRLLACHDKEKLHGPIISFFDTENPRTAAHYAKSQLDGALRVWNEDGERILFANYRLGKKKGLYCLFKDDLPWWIEQWNNNKQGQLHLVNFSFEEPSILTFANQEEARKHPEAAKALAEVATIESALDQGEQELRKAIRETYNELRKIESRLAKARSAPDRKAAQAARDAYYGRMANAVNDAIENKVARLHGAR